MGSQRSTSSKLKVNGNTCKEVRHKAKVSDPKFSSSRKFMQIFMLQVRHVYYNDDTRNAHERFRNKLNEYSTLSQDKISKWWTLTIQYHRRRKKEEELLVLKSHTYTKDFIGFTLIPVLVTEDILCNFNKVQVQSARLQMHIQTKVQNIKTE